MALLGHHNININILNSDPFLSSSPPHQPTQRRLGFFPSSTATRGKTSPSLHTHLDHKAQSHSHSQSESTAHKDILIPIMSSTACSSAANKVHTSPSKVRLGGVITLVPYRHFPLAALDTYLRRQTSHPRDASTRHTRRSQSCHHNFTFFQRIGIHAHPSPIHLTFNIHARAWCIAYPWDQRPERYDRVG